MNSERCKLGLISAIFIHHIFGTKIAHDASVIRSENTPIKERMERDSILLRHCFALNNLSLKSCWSGRLALSDSRTQPIHLPMMCEASH